MFIFKSYILSHKFYFCQERCISTIVSSMSVNSNQNTGTAGVVNNPNIAFCNFWNKWYSQSFSTAVFQLHLSLMQFSYVQFTYLLS